MSPILDIQRKFRELGRIRLGDRTEKGAPHKLAHFRLTSGSLTLLQAAAEQHGGTVREWKGAPTDGQYELYLETDRLPVVVPPGTVLSQWYELWKGGGCQRRCDGLTEQLSDTPCQCPPDPDARHEAAQKGEACKITTRMSVMLPNLPDIGVWRLESHGYYAAVEIAGTMALLERATAQGVLLPAQLRIEQRVTKKPNNGGTLRYIVPVLELPETTAQEFIDSLGLGLPGHQPALTPGAEAPAIAAPVAAVAHSAAIEEPAAATETSTPSFPPAVAPVATEPAGGLAGEGSPLSAQALTAKVMDLAKALGWETDRLYGWLRDHGHLTPAGKIKYSALAALQSEQSPQPALAL